ncbi:MAG: hypothetical protein V7K88_04390 [Nostoc sp.]
MGGVEFRRVSFQNTIMPDGSIRDGSIGDESC